LRKEWQRRERRYLPIALVFAFVPLLLFIAAIIVFYLAFGIRG